MQKRKLFLLSACSLLLLICILQAVTLKRNTVKIFALKDSPDSLLIENGSQKTWLFKDGDSWTVSADENSTRYAANDANVDSLLNAIKSVKALDKVGNAANEAAQIRYDLTDSKKITVKAYNGGKEVRKLTIGKASATGSQGYVMIDSSSDVYLSSGNLHDTFNKTVSDLRSNLVWTIDKNSIGSIALKMADGSEWKLSRTGQKENIEWKLDGHGIVTGEVDAKKAENWFGEFASLSAASWLDDNASPEGKYLLTCEIEAGDKKYALDLFLSKEEGENSPAEYTASSTESPYAFELAAYSARKFLKEAGELLK